jgi:GDP-4-dehydro-6-deoxy-D-mannose reductase
VMGVGNLESKRDFTDVRDTVKAYFLALERGEAGAVYNICSEKNYTMREILDKLLGMTDARIEVRQDAERMRPSDVPVLLGDCTRFRERTGWKPEIPFDQTLRDIMEFWRNR